MGRNATPRKAMATAIRPATPRMVSAVDVALVSAHAAKLAAKDISLEFGPWLGALSEVLARHGHLVVVDNFVWTKDHDRRLPGQYPIGGSFRPGFEATLRSARLKAEIVETDFSEFLWDGRPIRLCVIDAPKTSESLAALLSQIWGALTPDAVLIIKNGSNPSYPGMRRFIDHLVRHSVLKKSDLQGGDACNSVALGLGSAFHTVAASDALNTAFLDDVEAASPSAKEDLSLIFQALSAGNFAQAYVRLDRLKPSGDHLAAWEQFERTSIQRGTESRELELFAEIFVLHNDCVDSQPSTTAFHRSLSQTCRAYWINAAGRPWRGAGMQPQIFKAAADFGYLQWPNNMQAHVRGQDVLDVGCGPGLHGVGYLIGGAKSYVGLDPIIKLNKDVVKNITAKRKESFGRTPAEMMELMPGWTVSPRLTSDLTDDESFDVVTLHNVTEHLLQLEAVFADVRRLLRPGGIMIYNHHNFFSWNGHHLPPKSVADINPADPLQRELMDWAHLDYTPKPGHYIERGLNRLRLDQVIAMTQRLFKIEEMEEVQSRPAVGSDRLTDQIRAKHPDLADRDFLTQNLFCIARKPH